MRVFFLLFFLYPQKTPMRPLFIKVYTIYKLWPIICLPNLSWIKYGIWMLSCLFTYFRGLHRLIFSDLACMAGLAWGKDEKFHPSPVYFLSYLGSERLGLSDFKTNPLSCLHIINASFIKRKSYYRNTKNKIQNWTILHSKQPSV